MEYLLELLEGDAERLESGRRRNKNGIWDADPVVEYEAVEDLEKTMVIPVLLETPREPLVPFASGDGRDAPILAGPAVAATPPPAAATIDPLAAEAVTVVVTPVRAAGAAPPLTFDDPAMSWQHDEDPFADLGPVDPRPPNGAASASGAGAPPTRR